MTLAPLDLWILGGYVILTMVVGLWATRKAGTSSTEFFLSGRSMPWWMLGMSMVATTFSTDTPNLVTGLVRSGGVAANWTWWAFLLTGMLTVFVYARLWRRSGVTTDLEFYELRYSGAPAAFLRGFRAVYLGVFFNVMIMAAVTLAAIKIGAVIFGLSPVQTVLAASTATVIFSAAGGFRGVVLTDALLFVVSMTGSVLAAFFSVREVGGLGELLAQPAVVDRMTFLPDFGDPAVAVPLFFVPLAVQWWAAWYPGAEPGGGGYVAQRMLAARNENHAVAATLAFNVAHYALRPWPWILVALASLVVYPDVESLSRAFPGVDRSVVSDDLAYSAMLTFLPVGVKGLVVASLAAAYMSTISTHLNWGASYCAYDLYRRFVRPEAQERELVAVGRAATVVLMLLASLMALQLEDAVQAFQLLLQIGAGTGLLFILRWFWWRINAWSEIAAMVSSFLVALFFALGPDVGLAAWQELVVGVGTTTVVWLTATLLTRPTHEAKLLDFCRLTRPGGPGWRRFEAQPDSERDGEAWWVPRGLLTMLLATLSVYALLFALGFFLYGRTFSALVAVAIAVATGLAVGLRSRGGPMLQSPP